VCLAVIAGRCIGDNGTSPVALSASYRAALSLISNALEEAFCHRRSRRYSVARRLAKSADNVKPRTGTRCDASCSTPSGESLVGGVISAARPSSLPAIINRAAISVSYRVLNRSTRKSMNNRTSAARCRVGGRARTASGRWAVVGKDAARYTAAQLLLRNEHRQQHNAAAPDGGIAEHLRVVGAQRSSRRNPMLSIGARQLPLVAGGEKPISEAIVISQVVGWAGIPCPSR
jgi:hypothetical protein